MTVLQENDSLKKTPLYDRHVSLQGKVINFNGWALPVYYTGIIQEHRWARQNSGFFDVSHLGEIHVKGPDALVHLQTRLTNDLRKLVPGKILYSLLCNEQGFTLDDVLIYQNAADDYYVIVNAGGIERDFQMLQKDAPAALKMVNQSDQTACIAIQGPKSEVALQALFGFSLSDLKYYHFREDRFNKEPIWISRTGYTGEDGFEIFSSGAVSVEVWDRLANDGQKHGVLPCGLGSRNTLRLEAGNVLYGHELSEGTTPLEAGLAWAVSFEKGPFVGRDALLRQKQEGLTRRLVGFKVLEKPIARENYEIFKEGQKIGFVTSGSYGPSADANIGLGYVSKGNEMPGTTIEIQIHGRLVAAEVVKLPFIATKHKKG